MRTPRSGRGKEIERDRIAEAKRNDLKKKKKWIDTRDDGTDKLIFFGNNENATTEKEIDESLYSPIWNKEGENDFLWLIYSRNSLIWLHFNMWWTILCVICTNPAFSHTIYIDELHMGMADSMYTSFFIVKLCTRKECAVYERSRAFFLVFVLWLQICGEKKHYEQILHFLNIAMRLRLLSVVR